MNKKEFWDAIRFLIFATLFFLVVFGLPYGLDSLIEGF